MKIGNIIPPEPVQGRIQKTNFTNKSSRGDSVNISRAALEKAEQFRVIEIVSSAPDVRAERIAEIKAKINDPDYINEEMISKTADNIMDMLFSPGIL